MREIRFRAWIKPKYYMVNVETLMIGGGIVADLMMVGSDHYELMQFIGLHDKNGTEIYEGDIVRGQKGDFIHNVIGTVKYCGMGFCFEGIKESEKYKMSGGKNEGYWLYHVTSEQVKNLPEIEIIGNIYENPELLKG